MDILKAFKISGDEEVQINISGTTDEPLFQANQVGNILGLSNIRVATQDFDEDEKVVLTVGTLGGKQQTTFLTEVGLYRLLALSRKPVARQFQKWVAKVIKQIRLTGKYKAQQQSEIDLQLYKNKERLAIHNTLCSAFYKKKIVYICRLQELDDEYYVVKIGHTDDITSRIPNIVTAFGNCVLTDAFEIDYNKSFERQLHNDPIISQFAYTETINNRKPSTEAYRVNDNIYNEIIKVIQSKKGLYTKIDYNEIHEIEKTKLKRKEIELEIAKTQQQHSIGDANIAMEETSQDVSEDDASDSDISVEHFIKTRKQTRGSRIQQYEHVPNDPTKFNLIKTYDSIIDVLRENECFSTGGLKPACVNNTMYKGFRWYPIDRDKEIKMYDIPPTTNIREVSNELVAMLDINKSKIVQVFPSIKHAAEARHFKSLAAISKAIKKGTQSSGHYWCRYIDCNEDFKNEYEKTSPIPDKPPKANGVRVQQISMAKDRRIVREYNSMSEVTTRFQMSRLSLKNASMTDTPHNGYYWKIIEPSQARETIVRET